MSIFRIKETYTKACHESSELHVLTLDERLKLQAHLRTMYQEIETVCNRHGLTIMLAYGSVLGAIRHQGFIPWDDDLDVYMPRKDYDELVNKWADELPDNYIVYAPNSKNGPTYQFGKVIDTSTVFKGPGSEHARHHCGVYVDIFPLENISERPIYNKVKSFLLKILIGIAASVAEYESGSKLFRRLLTSSKAGALTYWLRQSLGFLFSFRSSAAWYNTLDRLFQQEQETGYLHEPSGIYTWKPIPRDVFLPVRRVKFDDIEANIPHNPYPLLERDYGDWHYIPKPEERWEHFLVDIQL